jgi:hypothetical protein
MQRFDIRGDDVLLGFDLPLMQAATIGTAASGT